MTEANSEGRSGHPNRLGLDSFRLIPRFRLLRLPGFDSLVPEPDGECSRLRGFTIQSGRSVILRIVDFGLDPGPIVRAYILERYPRTYNEKGGD